MGNPGWPRSRGTHLGLLQDRRDERGSFPEPEAEAPDPSLGVNVSSGSTFSSARVSFHGLPWWLIGKESLCNAGDLGSIPGWGRSPREGNGNPPQYSYLKNSWTEEPGGLQSMRLQKSDMTEHHTLRNSALKYFSFLLVQIMTLLPSEQATFTRPYSHHCHGFICVILEMIFKWLRETKTVHVGDNS